MYCPCVEARTAQGWARARHGVGHGRPWQALIPELVCRIFGTAITLYLFQIPFPNGRILDHAAIRFDDLCQPGISFLPNDKNRERGEGRVAQISSNTRGCAGFWQECVLSKFSRTRKGLADQTRLSESDRAVPSWYFYAWYFAPV